MNKPPFVVPWEIKNVNFIFNDSGQGFQGKFPISPKFLHNFCRKACSVQNFFQVFIKETQNIQAFEVVNIIDWGDGRNDNY
jgi:hypothetical protein